MAAVSGKDHLLALPAGGGKSLCYQVTAMALEGTTLVASARVPWMEEQIVNLRERGIAAACIHANRDRESLRAACVDYLNGRLRFLYVTPERLSVTGFPAMLARHKPALIAVEDAHRIVPTSEEHLSDYVLLREHLPTLRPAPILALTSSSTAALKRDIAALLGLRL